MINFNSVFFGVKKYYAENNITSPVAIKDIIDTIPLIGNAYSLYHYLEVLDQMGYITYSRQDDVISLTEKGRSADKLFTIDPR